MIFSSESTEKGHLMGLVFLSCWQFWHFQINYQVQLYLILTGKRKWWNKNNPTYPHPAFSQPITHTKDLCECLLWSSLTSHLLGRIWTQDFLFMVENWTKATGHSVYLRALDTRLIEERAIQWTHKPTLQQDLSIWKCLERHLGSVNSVNVTYLVWKAF